MKLPALLATLLIPVSLTAQVRPPVGLKPGDQYRVMFVTNTRSQARSADLSTYDALITAEASASPLGALATSWQIVASTVAIDARDHTQTDPSPAGRTGVPIYRPDGVRIADDYDHLWNADAENLLATLSVDASGVQVAQSAVWTGTNQFGTRHTPLGDPGGLSNAGSTNAVFRHWIEFSGASSQTAPNRLYGMSGVLTVPPPPLVPAGLKPGDQYRVMFVTNTRSQARSADITTYDALITAEASASPLGALATSWQIVASTVAIDARDHTQTDPSPAGRTGVPIYRPDGARIADDYDHLWNADADNLLATVSVDANGVQVAQSAVWTGTNQFGTRHTPLGDPGGLSNAGSTNAVFRHWIEFSGASSQTAPNRLYGMSGVLTVTWAPSAEVARLGTPPNPQAFMPGVTSGPVLGQTWDPVIDHASFAPSATLDFALFSVGPANTPLGPAGTLLCDLNGSVSVLTTPGVPFAVAIPNDPGLHCASLCVQGGSIDAGSNPSLANALDIAIGDF